MGGGNGGQQDHKGCTSKHVPPHCITYTIQEAAQEHNQSTLSAAWKDRTQACRITPPPHTHTHHRHELHCSHEMPTTHLLDT
jgi:hypothetical protein